jgi:hypothetical protein
LLTQRLIEHVQTILGRARYRVEVAVHRWDNPRLILQHNG